MINENALRQIQEVCEDRESWGVVCARCEKLVWQADPQGRCECVVPGISYWSKNAIILVWHWCGSRGMHIPWPRWMNSGVYPTCESDRSYVSLWSVSGQSDENLRQRMALKATDENRPAWELNLDDFGDDWLNPVNWEVVLGTILRVGIAVTRRSLLRHENTISNQAGDPDGKQTKQRD